MINGGMNMQYVYQEWGNRQDRIARWLKGYYLLEKKRNIRWLAEWMYVSSTIVK